MTILSILILLIIASLLAIIYIFNNLVSLRNRYRNAFSQIQVQLERRHNLIPNLVATTQGYLSHERETLEAVITARNQAASVLKQIKGSQIPAEMTQLLAKTESILDTALNRLMAVSEQYPELKADTSVAALFEELTSTEDRIAFARQAYNDMVMNYNTTCEQFPNNLISQKFKFETATLLDFDSSRKEVPIVQLNKS